MILNIKEEWILSMGCFYLCINSIIYIYIYEIALIGSNSILSTNRNSYPMLKL